MMKQYFQKKQIELNNNQPETKLATSSETESQRSSCNSTIAYKLFMYREELRNSQGLNLKLSKCKLNLTQELVSYSVDRITEYGVDELVNINRQISFTRKLKHHMDAMKQMQKMQKTRASQSPPTKVLIRSSG